MSTITVPWISPELLAAHRRARGMNQEELSAKSGFSVGTISGAEAGTRQLSRFAVDTLAQALEVSPASFFDAKVLKEFVSSRTPVPADHHDKSGNSPTKSVVEPIRANSDILQRYKLMPKANAGIRMRINLQTSEHWSRTPATIANALSDFGLEAGNTIDLSSGQLFDGNMKTLGYFSIYATDENAAALLDLSTPAIMEVEASTIFGVIIDPYGQMTGYHDPTIYEDLTGFVIETILGKL